MNNFSDMISKAKKIQEQMKEVQENLKKIEVEGTAAGRSGQGAPTPVQFAWKNGEREKEGQGVYGSRRAQARERGGHRV